MHYVYDEIGKIILPDSLSIIWLFLSLFYILNHIKMSAASYETSLCLNMYMYVHTQRVHFERKSSV